MKKSTAKFGERCENPNPEVGEPAAKFVFRGKPLVIPLPEVVPLPITTGGCGSPAPVVTPLPFVGAGCVITSLPVRNAAADDSVTVTPCIGFPRPSLTVTVIVEGHGMAPEELAATARAVAEAMEAGEGTGRV